MIFFIFPSVGNNHPNWLIFFQRGWNHQPDMIFSCLHDIPGIFWLYFPMISPWPPYDSHGNLTSTSGAQAAPCRCWAPVATKVFQPLWLDVTWDEELVDATTMVERKTTMSFPIINWPSVYNDSKIIIPTTIIIKCIVEVVGKSRYNATIVMGKPPDFSHYMVI